MPQNFQVCFFQNSVNSIDLYSWHGRGYDLQERIFKLDHLLDGAVDYSCGAHRSGPSGGYSIMGSPRG